MDKGVRQQCNKSHKKVESLLHFLKNLVYEKKPIRKEKVLMDNLTELYCFVDEFCKEFEPLFKTHLLSANGKHKRNRAACLSLADLMARLAALPLTMDR